MKNQTILNFILKSLRPFKYWIIAQCCVGTVWAIDLSLRPYIVKIILNKIPLLTPETINSELSVPIVFYLAMSLLIVFIFRFSDYIWIKINPPLKRHVADILMKQMMDHSLTLFQNHFAGNLANKIKDVMNGIPDLLKICINQFFSHFLALSLAILTVWTINYKISALLALWIIIFTIGSFCFTKHAKKLCYEAADIRSNVIGQFVDILSNIASVHLFSSKKNESKTLKKHLDDHVNADQRRDKWFLYMFAFQGFSFVVYQCIAFVFLMSGFQEGTVTAGDFGLLITINIAIINCLWSLSTDILNFSEFTGNITQGLKVALSPLEIKDKINAKIIHVAEGRIVFDAVQFQYQGAESLFENKSVTIEPGQKVGLVGSSGSGKSTFINLILRLYDVNQGRILIDNQDIRDVTQDSLRSVIGMIPQDPSLFHRTLMENIRYGLIDSSDDAIIMAAKKAHAHEFIIKLPQQYHSLVGERGVKLSGGQRQRIAIARAILKNAPILILDEATSQLDSITEVQIQESLWTLMDRKTTIIVAHRLSTLLHMDRILVFDEGKIVEDGSHHTLLKLNGLYKKLWDTQVGGFLVE